MWTAEEKEQFRSQFASDIAAQWSGHFTFGSTKPYWDTLAVPCSINVVEPVDDPHYQLTVDKYPADADMSTSSVCPAGTHHAHVGNACPANEAEEEGGAVPERGTGRFDSNDLRDEMKLVDSRKTIPFSPGNDTLDSTGTDAAVDIGMLMIADPALQVTLVGRANSAPGDGISSVDTGMTAADLAIEKMDLARRRTEQASAVIQSGGISAERIFIRNAGMGGAGPGDSWDRVDAKLSVRETQLPGLHEAGHMLGLGDEYGTTASPSGTAVLPGYQSMLDANGGPTLARGRNESAMSVGSTVEPWHYTPFLEALKAIDGSNDWMIR